MYPKAASGIANSVDPDLIASLETAQTWLSENLGILWYKSKSEVSVPTF